MYVFCICAPPTPRRLSERCRGLGESLGDKSLMKFLRYKNYDSGAAFRMIEYIHAYRVNYPERWIERGKGPRDYDYVYDLRCVEVLRHRNPRDGSAVIVMGYCTEIYIYKRQ